MKPELPSEFEQLAESTLNPILTEAILETLASVAARKFVLFTYNPGQITIETDSGMELGYINIRPNEYEVSKTVGRMLHGSMLIRWVKSGNQIRYWIERTTHIIDDHNRYSSIQGLENSESFRGFLTRLGS